jgi:hypothetical protein
MTRREAAEAWVRRELVREPLTVQGEMLAIAQTVIVHPFRKPYTIPPILVRLRYEGEDDSNPSFLERVGAPVPVMSAGRERRSLPWVAVYAAPGGSAALVLYPDAPEEPSLTEAATRFTPAPLPDERAVGL